MNIRKAYIEKVDAALENYKAKVALAKADAKVAQAKSEALSNLTARIQPVLNNIEAAKTKIKGLRTQGEELLLDAKARTNVAWAGMKSLISNMPLKLR